MQIMTALIVSTAHITEAEDRAIKEGNPPGELHTPFVWDYGYIFHVGEIGDDTFDPDLLSAGMLGVFRYALEQQIEWVRFDCDGPTLDGIETYDW